MRLLSTPQSNSEQRSKISREIDNYEQNIQVLLSLERIFEKKYKGHSIISKKMKFKDNPNDSVRPDLETELVNGVGVDYGIVTESKVSLPLDHSLWEKDVKQLKRYDSTLDGWQRNVGTHDILFVTDISLTLHFWEKLQEFWGAGKYQFERRLAICGFSRQEKEKLLLVIIMEHGNLSDPILESAFQHSERISGDEINDKLEAVKFYDATPPTTYTMDILWAYIFPKIIPEDDFRKYARNRYIPVEVKIDDLLNTLQSRFAPPENGNVVKREWVIDAMQEFVKIKLAEPDKVIPDKYTVFFRKRKTKSKKNFILNLMYGEPKPEVEGEDKRDPFQQRLDF